MRNRKRSSRSTSDQQIDATITDLQFLMLRGDAAREKLRRLTEEHARITFAEALFRGAADESLLASAEEIDRGQRESVAPGEIQSARRA